MAKVKSVLRAIGVRGHVVLAVACGFLFLLIASGGGAQFAIPRDAEEAGAQAANAIIFAVPVLAIVRVVRRALIVERRKRRGREGAAG